MSAAGAAAIPAGDLGALARRELQALAKACGLKANAKSEELAAQLTQLRDAAAGGAAAPCDADMDAAQAEQDAELDAEEAAAAAVEAQGNAAAAQLEPEAQEDADMAALKRQLEPVFCSTLEEESSPVLGLLGAFVRRRGGAARAEASPFAFGTAAPRSTLTPPLSGGSGGWLSAARASLGALVADWKQQSASPRPQSLLRATLTGAPAARRTPHLPGPPARFALRGCEVCVARPHCAARAHRHSRSRPCARRPAQRHSAPTRSRTLPPRSPPRPPPRPPPRSAPRSPRCRRAA
jgi:hypothetical protein